MDRTAQLIHEKCPNSVSSTQANTYDECPYIVGDFSARTINHHYFWNKEPANQDVPVPRQTNLDKIRHVYSDTRVLVILRNPVERLFSDYKYYASSHHDIVTADDFHERVTSAIETWRNCTHLLELPHERCAYGFNFPRELSRAGFWGTNSIDRLRVSIYSIYVINCLHVFPREQVHVIKMEEFTEDPLSYTQTHLLPFLRVRPFDEDEVKQVRSLYTNANHNFRFANVTMHAHTREMLNSFFEPYNQQLAELLHDDKFLWKKKN